MKMSFQLIAGAAIAACAGIALAQISPPPPSSTSPSTSSGSSSSSTDATGSSSSSSGSSASSDQFNKLDADKDGMITKKEAAKDKGLTAKWTTLDTNKDGKLDPGEFAAYEAPKY